MPAELVPSAYGTCQNSSRQGAMKSCSPGSVPPRHCATNHMRERYKEKLLALGCRLLSSLPSVHCRSLVALVKPHMLRGCTMGKLDTREDEHAAGVHEASTQEARSKTLSFCNVFPALSIDKA